MTVVVGVRGPAGSRTAIQEAAREARYRQTTLVGVMAYHQESTLGAPAARPVATLGTGEDARAVAEEDLRAAVRVALGAPPGQVDMRVLAGPPGHTLIQAACDTDAELVVLAARGDGTVARLLGTVSQFVLRNAPCPVLVVPDTHRAAAHAWATTGAHTGPGAQP
jgi:nucleotide-binding universal stress UspA family protein